MITLTASGRASLILVSDMIEHTPDYSQYQGDLSYEHYKQSIAYKKQHTDLKGADVTIFYVQRLRMDYGESYSGFGGIGFATTKACQRKL